MFDYPPVHTFGPQTSAGHCGRATACGRAVVEIAKRRRHDISIGLQSALSTVYAVELVFYFVRLRHLTNKNMAAWRASLMLLLLALDIAFIWLTVRNKRQADLFARSAVVRRNVSVFHGFPAPGAARPTAPQADPHQELPPYNVALSNLDPHVGGRGFMDARHATANEPPPPPPPVSVLGGPRSHLNTPITG